MAAPYYGPMLLLAGIIVGTKAPSVRLTPAASSVDLTAGKEVCLNTPTVEFSCVGQEVSFLAWQRNGVEIEPNFHIGRLPGTYNSTNGPYTLFLDNVTDVEMRVANITTRLLVNISYLMSGDEIVCATLGMNSSKILNYTFREPPPVPTNFSISLKEENATFNTFNISWDPSFNTAYGVSFYRVTPVTIAEIGEDLTVNCPSSCAPDVPCQCTGLAVGDRVTVNISAVNCETQEGTAAAVIIASTCQPENLGKFINKINPRCGTLTSSTARTNIGGSVTIPNGVGCFNATFTGSVATYRCNEGHALVNVGDSVVYKRTCHINGSWSGSIPECEEVSRRSTSFLIAVISSLVIIVVIIIVSATVILFILRRIHCQKRKDPDNNNIMTNVRPQIKLKKRMFSRLSNWPCRF